MTYDSSNKEEIEALETNDLIQRIRESMKQGCIHPSHVFDMVDEALQRLWFITDSNKCLEQDNQNLRKGLVGKCHCKHYKGLHENDYADCLVVCSLHDDDYVSISACQTCPDYELEMKDDQAHA